MFLAISMHEITLYAIDIHKNRFITPFLTLKNHFGKRTSMRPRIVQHPRPCHMRMRIMQVSDAFEVLQECYHFWAQ